MTKKIMLCLSIIIICTAFITSCKNIKPVKRKITENLISTISPKWSIEQIVTSPDNKRLAYKVFTTKKIFITNKNRKMMVIVDGNPEEIFDAIMHDSPYFSPDSKHVTYCIQLGDKTFIVTDGKKNQKQFDGIMNGTPVFSPDSKRIAYASVKDYSPTYNEDYYRRVYKWSVVVDEIEGQRFDMIDFAPFFSPDNKHFAYGASLNGERCIVVDGRIMGNFYYYVLFDPKTLFSPDCKKTAFLATAGGKDRVVTNGVEGRHYDSVMKSTPVISPDSKHVAYGAALGDKRFVIVDEKIIAEYEGIGENTLRYSPDAKHFVYAVVMIKISP